MTQAEFESTLERWYKFVGIILFKINMPINYQLLNGSMFKTIIAYS